MKNRIHSHISISISIHIHRNQKLSFSSKLGNGILFSVTLDQPQSPSFTKFMKNQREKKNEENRISAPSKSASEKIMQLQNTV